MSTWSPGRSTQLEQQFPGMPQEFGEPQQEPQAGAGAEGALEVVLWADMSFVRSELPQVRQSRASSSPKTRTSVTSPHFPQRYSYIGMFFLPFSHG